jgi:hypothetical protein
MMRPVALLALLALGCGIAHARPPAGELQQQLMDILKTEDSAPDAGKGNTPVNDQVGGQPVAPLPEALRLPDDVAEADDKVWKAHPRKSREVRRQLWPWSASACE